MENPIKMDDLGMPLFSETSIYMITIMVYDIYPHLACVVDIIPKIYRKQLRSFS